jgi:hypothetical protein
MASALAKQANRLRSLRSFSLCASAGRPSLTVISNNPFRIRHALHDRIRRVLDCDRTVTTVSTRERRRRDTNVGELNAEAGETLNPKWTMTRFHGGLNGRISRILPRYRLPADTLMQRDGLPLLYMALEGLLDSCGILSLTCHQRTSDTIETGLTFPEDWRLRKWLFPIINSHLHT